MGAKTVPPGAVLGAHQLGATYTSAGAQITGSGFTFRVGTGVVGRRGSFTGLASHLEQTTGAAIYGSGALTEQFHPVVAGIEQTFHVAHRSRGKTPLTIDVPISGLAAVTNAPSIDLHDIAGHVVATYSGLRVLDSKGRTVPAIMTSSANGTAIEIKVQDAKADYPLTVDPTWSNPAIDIYVAGSSGVEPVNPSTGVIGTNEATGLTGSCQLCTMVISPGGTKGYLLDWGHAEVLPVNLATGTVGTGIQVPAEPDSIVMSPNGQTVYVTSFNYGQSYVTPINTSTNTAGTSLSIYPSVGVSAISPNGQTLWLGGIGSGDYIIPMNLGTDTLGAQINLPESSFQLVMSPNGQTLYAIGANGVYPVTLATGTVGSLMSVYYGGNPQTMAISPSGNVGYVTNQTSTVTPVNLVTGTVGTPISLAGLPNNEGTQLISMTVSADGQTGYVLNAATPALIPLNLSTGTPGTPITGALENYSLAQEPLYTVYPQGSALNADLRGGGSRSEKCLTCGIPAIHNTKYPINTATGDFYTTATDITLPGAGVPLSFTRTYDAQAAQAQAGQAVGPLGYGWSNNVGMSVSYNASTQLATVTEENGAQITFNKYVSGSADPWCSTTPNFCAGAPRIDATLNQNADGTWTFTRMTGTTQIFSFNSSGALTQVADAVGNTLNSLVYSPSGGQTACPTGDTCTAWKSSASGREMVLAVNPGGQLVTVFDANSSMAATFAYSGSGCSSWSGSETPDLCSAVDPGSITSTYTYDSGNASADLDYDMLSETPPGTSGQAVNVYNSSGQVTQQTDPAGGVTTFAYSGTNSTVPGGTTTITTYPDGTGSGQPQDVTVDNYSANALVGETTGSGTSNAVTTAIARDPASVMAIAVADGNGNTAGSAYQTYGGPGGTSVSSANELTSTDAMANTTQHAYTAANQVWCSVDAADYASSIRCPSSAPTSPPSSGTRIGYTLNIYNSVNELTSTTDPLGNTTSNSYTLGVSGVPNGLLYCSVDPVDYQASINCPAYGAAHVRGTTTKTYDASGDVLTSTDADGNTTSFAYGSAANPGLPTVTTDPDGKVTTDTYNAAGEVLAKTVTDTSGTYTATTQYSYDSAGRRFCEVSAFEYAQSVRCPSSAPTSPPTGTPGYTDTIYNANAQVTSTTNPIGGTTQSAYDGSTNRYCTVSATNYASGTRCPSTAPTTPPTVGSDPYLGAAITTFDAAGQSIQVTNALGGITLSTYDPAGNVASTTAESNNATAAPNVVTAYTYDADNRVASTTVGSGSSNPATTLTNYDPNGHAFCTVSANAHAAGSSAYQCPAWQSGWIVTPPSPTGTAPLYSTTPTPSQANNVTTAFFNADGTRVQSTNADVQTSVTAVDADQRAYCTSDPTNVSSWSTAHPSGSYPYLCPSTPPTAAPTGTTTGYTTTIVDAAGRSLSSTDQVGDTTSYTYDGSGNRLTVTDPRGKVTTNCYYGQNGTGQCAAGAPAGGGSFDDLYSTTTPATTADPSGETSTYTYFAGGALDTATTPAATATDGYDSAGDLTSKSYSGIGSGYSAPANTSASFNMDGTTHTVTDATGTTTYGYDAMGNVTSQALVATGGLANATTSYSYYTTGAKATVTYPAYSGHSSPVVAYTYDPTGALASSLDWLGNTVNFAHNADGNTTNQANNVSTSNPGGTSSTASTYDNADLPTAATTSINQTCGGAETVSQSFAGATGSRNPDGQLTSETTGYSATCSGQSTSTLDYSFNTAGQVTFQGTAPQGASPANLGFDASGDPTTLSSHAGATLDTFTQAFDAAGEVTSQTAIAGSGGSTSNYTYDNIGDQTQASGGTNASYVYNGAGQMAAATTSSGSTSYLYNAQGLEAAATKTWGPPSDVNSTRAINATTCVSSTFCVAVGASGYAVTYNGTSWSAPFDADSTRNLDAVSCASSSFCVAVDTSGYATIYNGTSWSTPSDVDGSRSLNAISCPSGTFCFAVGSSGYIVKYNNGWKTPVDNDSTRNVDAISCTSSSFCAAVDTSGFALTWNGSSWTAPSHIDLSRNIDTVSCSSSSFCVTGDTSGYATTYNGTSWTSATDVDLTRAIKALACPSSSLCVAVDASGYAVTYNGSAWATPVDADGARALDALSCPSTSFCSAVDTSGYATTYNGSTWSTPTDMDASRSVSSVSCTSSTFCVAVDTSGYAGTYATGPSSTAQLTWDLTSIVPNILSDGSVDYLYGPDSTPIEEIALSTSTPTYLSYVTSDATWVSTNEAGDLTGLWSYDAFGTLATSTVSNGTPTSAFGYGGQYADATTGFGVNRARYYDPAIGTFVTRDPAFGSTDTAYTYAGGDPVNGSDPTGLCSDSGGVFLVPGPCPNTSAGALAAEATIQAQSQLSNSGFSFTQASKTVADYGAAIGNSVVSAVTLNHVHISVPFCNVPLANLASTLGNVEGVLLGTVGGAELFDGLFVADTAAVGARGAAVEVTQAGETFVRVGASPESLNWTFDGVGGTRPGTFAFPQETFEQIGTDPAALKNFGDLPGEPPSVFRILEPPAGTPIQRGIVPGGEFGGEGGVPEVYFPAGW